MIPTLGHSGKNQTIKRVKNHRLSGVREEEEKAGRGTERCQGSERSVTRRALLSKPSVLNAEGEARRRCCG